MTLLDEILFESHRRQTPNYLRLPSTLKLYIALKSRYTRLIMRLARRTKMHTL